MPESLPDGVLRSWFVQTWTDQIAHRHSGRQRLLHARHRRFDCITPPAYCLPERAGRLDTASFPSIATAGFQRTAVFYFRNITQGQAFRRALLDHRFSDQATCSGTALVETLASKRGLMNLPEGEAARWSAQRLLPPIRRSQSARLRSHRSTTTLICMTTAIGDALATPAIPSITRR